LQLGIEELTSC